MRGLPAPDGDGRDLEERGQLRVRGPILDEALSLSGEQGLISRRPPYLRFCPSRTLRGFALVMERSYGEFAA